MVKSIMREKIFSPGRVVVLAAIIFLSWPGFFYAGGSFKNEARAQSPKPSGFSLYDLNGNLVNLSDFKGRPVILFFWATWCPYCREKFPQLAQEYPNMKSKNIVFLAVDIGEQKSRVESYFKSKNIQIEFPVLLDQNSKVASGYNIVGIPTFIVIGSQGQILFSGNSFPSDYESILN